jgi:ubiquinone/menaquinone biosynthesis C-methylase UbiE
MSQHPDDLFAGTAHYYARYRPPYPEEFFRHVVERFGLDGEGRLLDIGCGPGLLTIPFAPHFAEVVGVDPDPAMLAEADAVAEQAGVRNARWIQGRDTDLERLGDEIGSVRLATFGRAFHWMDRDGTLRALDRIVEPGGGVVICSDAERVWNFDGGWQRATQEVIRRWLGDVRRAGSGIYNVRHVPFTETLEASAFSRVVYYSTMIERHPTTDDIVGYLYSTSFCSPHVLGDNQEAFEADLRQRLSAINPEGRFSERLGFEAWLATREIPLET